MCHIIQSVVLKAITKAIFL